ncbi:MAG TPA: DNA polymerase, partial [Candidatus Saccharimonas sp.]|nr:DNA polymerase [Candidatus Saccharimonas sp.]
LLSRLPAGPGSGAGAKASNDEGELTLFGPGEGRAKPERSHLGTVTYKAVQDMAELQRLAKELAAVKCFAFDTETTGVDTLVADLVGMSVCFKTGEAYYIPVGHVQGSQLARDEALEVLRPVFENPAIGKTGHNLKFDYEVMAKHGVRMQGIVFDTMIAAFLLNSAGRGPSLDDLAYSELGVEMIPIAELIGTGRNQITFAATEIEPATTYAAEDADMAWRLYERLRPRLAEATPVNEYGWTVERLADEVEWPTVTVLAEMELAGIELDTAFLAKYGQKLNAQIAELKEQIYKYAGEEFNLESPAQLGQILYGRLGLSQAGVKKGKTGLSTAATELEKLRDAHPVVPLLMQYRELTKLMSTYVEALPAQVAADGRVHTNFSQTIVPSGRLSSNNPNLQNIPVRTEAGREIRTAFVAPKGRVLVAADYSQIELRAAAALSGDTAMTQTFRDGEDLHIATAAELYGVDPAAVTKDQRAAAKTVNFGVLYGISAHGLSVGTGMDIKQAQGFIDRYFEIRPQLRAYLDGLKKQAYDEGYVATWFNRRRATPEVRSANFMHRQAAERVALNIPIQGTAADIYKLAMIAVTEKLASGEYGDAKLLLQIHDELIVECPEAQGAAVAEMLCETMESVIDIGVPLVVDTSVGTNWGEL